jgi:hypothetical protein
MAAGSASLVRHLRDPQDRFVFVKESAKKALDGDGKAARLISSALTECLVIQSLYGEASDPQMAFLVDEGSKKNLPQWAALRDEVRFRSCKRFFKEDPFEGLPAREGGYNSPRYWSNLAYRYKDPVALVQHVAAQMIGSSAKHDAATYQTLQNDLDSAVESGDLEALFRIGMILTNGSTGDDTVRASAVSLAACNMGYDCSSKNEIAFGPCLAAGSCQEGDIFPDRIRQLIGEEKYARAYALSQQLQTDISQNDTAAIAQIIHITATQDPTQD